MQGLRGNADALLGGDPGQVPFQRFEWDAAKIKPLAAAQDCGQHPLGIGGGQHKHHPRWRFFEGLEQGVEGGGREHVALVDHVDLPAGLHRCKAGAFDQLSDVVDAGVGGGVNLDHIEGVARGDACTELTAAAGLGRGAAAADAVERAGQDPGARGFASAAGPAQQVSRSNPAAGQGVAERGCNRFLADQLVETLRPVLVMQGLVGLSHRQRLGRLHGPKSLLAVAGTLPWWGGGGRPQALAC